MKSYFIFAVVLTVAYLIYYAVIIVQDLYGKKGTGKTDEEVFDLGAPDDEQSVDVTESETGLSIGSEKYETEAEPAALPAAQEEDAPDNGEAAAAGTAESQGGGTDGRDRALPVGRPHGGRAVQGNGL